MNTGKDAVVNALILIGVTLSIPVAIVGLTYLLTIIG